MLWVVVGFVQSQIGHRVFWGGLKKAAPAVPAGEPSAKVGIVVFGDEPMVNLMLSGAQKPPLYGSGKTHPNMAVAEVPCQCIAEQADAMHTQDGELHGSPAKEPVGKTSHHAGCDKGAFVIPAVLTTALAPTRHVRAGSTLTGARVA